MQKYQGKLWSSRLVCLCVCFLVIIALFILTSCGSTSGKTSNPVPSPKSSPITSGERVIVYTDGEFGRTVLARRANDGTPLWHFQSGKSISTSVSDPVVVNHGVVYIAMAATSYTGSMTSMGDWLYAVRMSDGMQLWQYQADADIHSITVTDGTVYLISNALTSLTALRANDGHLLWKQTTDTSTGMTITGLVIDSGVVYISTGEWGLKFAASGSLYALHANDGSLLWQSQLGNHHFFPPQLVNGIIYVGASDDYWPYYERYPQPFSDSLYAVRASDGGQLWHSEIWPSQLVRLHYQESQGVVYVTTAVPGSSSASTVTALEATQGTSLWQSQVNNFSTGVTVAGGVVYAYEDRGKLNTLRASDGTALWNAQVQPQDNTPPSLQVLADEEGAYLVSTFRDTGNDSNMGVEPGSLEVRKATDGTVVWHYPYQSKQYTTFALSNGMVYVGSNPNGPAAPGSSICAIQASTGSQHWCLQTNTQVQHLTVGA